MEGTTPSLGVAMGGAFSGGRPCPPCAKAALLWTPVPQRVGGRPMPMRVQLGARPGHDGQAEQRGCGLRTCTLPAPAWLRLPR